MEPEPVNDFRNNFFAFWKDMDQNYIFFDIKRNANWDSVYEANMAPEMSVEDPYSTDFWVKLLKPFYDYHLRIYSNTIDETLQYSLTNLYLNWTIY